LPSSRLSITPPSKSARDGSKGRQQRFPSFVAGSCPNDVSRRKWWAPVVGLFLQAGSWRPLLPNCFSWVPPAAVGSWAKLLDLGSQGSHEARERLRWTEWADCGSGYRLLAAGCWLLATRDGRFRGKKWLALQFRDSGEHDRPDDGMGAASPLKGSRAFHASVAASSYARPRSMDGGERFARPRETKRGQMCLACQGWVLPWDPTRP
jgi:hypothetical protein